MTRLSKTLFVAAALLAAPVSTAFADEPVAGEEGGGGGEGGEGGAAATPAPSGGDVSATAPGERPSSIIDRSLTLVGGGLAVQADVGILRIPGIAVGQVMSEGTTSVGMVVGAGYGVNEKLTVGGQYGFTLNEFEIKGPLTAYGAYNLSDNGKLAVTAGADVELDLAQDNAFTIQAGLAVRYKVAPKFAVFTGNPYTPGPAGQHLSIGLSEGAAKTFSLPVGAAYQATPQLYAYLTTNLATISLSDPGVGDRVTTFNNSIPLGIGAWFNINKNLDAGASYADDLQSFGDAFLVLVGARYYN